MAVKKGGIKIEHKHELWKIEKLIDYARNPRKNDHAVDKVAAAIAEYGFKVPIIARSDGLVVDGHLRLKAARKLGLEKVPVIIADDLTETQVKAFRISVNRLSELAEWDNDLLQLELEDIKLYGFDISLTGFDDVVSTSNEFTPDLPDEDSNGGSGVENRFTLLVTLENKHEQEELFQALTEMGYRKIKAN